MPTLARTGERRDPVPVPSIQAVATMPGDMREGAFRQGPAFSDSPPLIFFIRPAPTFRVIASAALFFLAAILPLLAPTRGRVVPQKA